MSVQNSQSSIYGAVEQNNANAGVATTVLTQLTWQSVDNPAISGCGYQGSTPGNGNGGTAATPSTCRGLIAPVNGIYYVQGTLVFPGLVANTDSIIVYLSLRNVADDSVVIKERIGAMTATAATIATPMTFNGSTLYGMSGGAHYASLDIIWNAATSPSSLAASFDTVLKMALIRSV